MLTKQSAENIVKGNILPFWEGMIDKENGGFYGEADFYGKINKTADKGGILNSRILWTFSAAYRMFKDEKYKECADHAFEFLKFAFLDKEHGGLFWKVDYKGHASGLETSQAYTRKQIYNIAFGVYALSEYYLACRDKSALELALSLFDITERYGRDYECGGYIEASTRDWSKIDDYRLSSKELNCPKSMNTCLHVLEAWTALTIAGSQANAPEKEKVRKSLEEILRIMQDKIVNKNWHFDLFFNMEWKSLSKEISYGHDIEGAWLLYEAALAAENDKLIAQVKQTAINIAKVIYTKALDHKNGGLISACSETGKIQEKKDWWPQAEAVVGFYNAYELSGEKKYMEASSCIWEYIQNHFIDTKNGEWYNELFMDNTPDTKMPKAGFWKCPYHNARSCFEIIKRLN